MGSGVQDRACFGGDWPPFEHLVFEFWFVLCSLRDGSLHLEGQLMFAKSRLSESSKGGGLGLRVETFSTNLKSFDTEFLKQWS